MGGTKTKVPPFVNLKIYQGRKGVRNLFFWITLSSFAKLGLFTLNLKNGLGT